MHNWAAGLSVVVFYDKMNTKLIATVLSLHGIIVGHLVLRNSLQALLLWKSFYSLIKLHHFRCVIFVSGPPLILLKAFVWCRSDVKNMSLDAI